MDASILVHDFPAPLCVVFGAVLDRQDVMRLDVCGIDCSLGNSVSFTTFEGAVLRGVLPSKMFPVSNECSIILCVISVCLIHVATRDAPLGQCQTVTRD